jgi:UPF0716 family protein affecting phage T7 exclusion
MAEPMEAPARKTNVWIILAIVGGIILICCCVLAAIIGVLMMFAPELEVLLTPPAPY